MQCLLTWNKPAEQHQRDSNTNCAIGQVEVWPPSDRNEINNITEPKTVSQIAQCPAQDQSESDELKERLPWRPRDMPSQNQQRHGRGHKHHRSGASEETKGNASILDVLQREPAADQVN